MKKIVLPVLVAGALLATSCKETKKAGNEIEKAADKTVKATEKATEKVTEGAKDLAEGAKELANEAGDKIKSLFDGVDMPDLKNEKLEKNLEDYANYAKEYIAVKGNIAKNPKLVTKGANILKEGQELLKTADAKTVNLYNKTLQAIQSKMAPAK